MSMDAMTIGAGFLSFALFLAVHFITFRWVRPERLLRSLLIGTVLMLALPAVLIFGLWSVKAADLSLGAWVCAALVSSLIEGLLCFFYVLCIFGPYETSVRMRLVREIAAGGACGITFKDLDQRYNAESIVQVRLQRLLGSGDIVEHNGLYRIISHKNLFFIFDAIAGILKKWIGR